MLQNIIVHGLLNGGVYALLAVGFSLMFGVARIVNLAFTAYYMLAAYFIYLFSVMSGVNPLLSIVLAIIIVSTLGLGTYKIFIDPIREYHTTVIIITIAMALVFQEAIQMFFGSQYRGLPPLLEGYFTVMNARVTYQYVLTFTVVIVILAIVWLILMKTKIGLDIRATAQDREVANLMGIDTNHIAVMTMFITIILACIAGAMVAPLFVVEPHMWMHPIVIILAAVVLGGMGSIKGSFIGAFILAFAEVSVVFMVPMGSYFKGAVALAIMVIVLLTKPEGLFGITIEGER